MSRVGVLDVTPSADWTEGSIRLDGGKHSFAHALACAALADEGVLHNVPDHLDARALRAGLALIFKVVQYDPVTRRMAYGSPRVEPLVVIRPELAAMSRSLFCLYPALLCRADEVRVLAPPVGCAIGARPSTWYIDTLRAFGVTAEDVDGALTLRWRVRRSADIEFAYPTMTGTVLAIAAAAAVAGRSTIANRSVEPSCDDQIDCLGHMGARVDSDSVRVTIESPGAFGSAAWVVPHDRIHAVTYLTAGLIARGAVTVVGSGPMRIPRFLDFLRAAGCRVDEAADRITARLPAEGALRPVALATGSEPRFSSDWVPMAALLLSLRASSVSEIVDDVFPDRLQFFDNLRSRRLAPVDIERIVTPAGRPAVRARIQGRPETVLRAGTYPTVPDIRGSAAIVLAALAADDATRVIDDFHIRRGYTDLAGDLRRLGMTVVRSEQ
jgi:UDP-N-acetylglucosamine 1-carboxyvinyltransferase